MRYSKTTWVAGVAALGILAGGCAHRQAGERSANAQPAEAGNGQNGGMQRFQQKFPGTSALMRSVMGVRILMQAGKHPLTPEQARAIDTALRPLPTMATLPQDKAQQIAQQVSGNLTPDQQNDIGLLRRSFRGRRGMWGNRPGGRGGNGPSGQNQPNAGQGQGGRRMRWMNENMAPDENIFRTGPANHMLTGVLKQLQGIEKS